MISWGNLKKFALLVERKLTIMLRDGGMKKEQLIGIG
jgi:hypothetical protein